LNRLLGPDKYCLVITALGILRPAESFDLSFFPFSPPGVGHFPENLPGIFLDSLALSHALFALADFDC
jgi:hypothetical protein